MAKFFVSCSFVMGLLFSLAACGSMLFDQRIIMSGEIYGLKIGDSKEITLEAIKRLNVGEIGAAPARMFYAYAGHTDGLAAIEERDEIAVRSNAGVSIFRFENGISQFVVRPTKVETADILSLEHQQIDIFKAKLRALLENVKDSSANPILATGSQSKVGLHGDQESLSEFLRNHDAWVLNIRHEPPAGVTLTLRFSQGQLIEIKYFRSRTALDISP